MPAFVEKLCEHVGVVRVGPDAHVFGDPYRYAFIYVIENGYAVCKGLADAGFNPAEYREAIQAINHATGKLASYDRAKTPYRTVQKDLGQTEGKIIMHKAHEAIKADGTVDHVKVAEGAAYWMQQIQSGAYKLITGGEAELGGGNTLIWFVRHKN